jgi:hypothetical protein
MRDGCRGRAGSKPGRNRLLAGQEAEKWGRRAAFRGGRPPETGPLTLVFDRRPSRVAAASAKFAVEPPAELRPLQKFAGGFLADESGYCGELQRSALSGKDGRGASPADVARVAEMR